jgi:two-component system, response regulator YesN
MRRIVLPISVGSRRRPSERIDTMKRLLLVDPEASACETSRQLLQRACQLIWAVTAQQARSALTEADLDIAILEMCLPDGSGLELLAEIVHRRPALPVIIATRATSQSLRRAAIRLGAKEYFEKPVDGITLANSVLVNLARAGNVGRFIAAAPGELVLLTAAKIRDVRLRRAVEYIHEHYREGVDLSVVARASAMGRFTLSRSFSCVLGVPFKKYLQRVRVVRAMELLASTDCRVTYIAEAVGFGELSRFNFIFRRFAGVTPTAFRRLRQCEFTDDKAGRETR